MFSHHRMGDNGNGPDRVIGTSATNATGTKKTTHGYPQELVTVLDEDPAVVNPLSPSAKPSSSVEQRGRSRRQQRSRSRERAPPHVPPHASQQPQRAAPPPGEQQIQPLAIQGADEESATVEPQSRVSDLSRSPQRGASPKTQGRSHGGSEDQRSRSTSPWIQTKTMKNFEMSLELLQTLSPLSQCYLSARISYQFTRTIDQYQLSG